MSDEGNSSSIVFAGCREDLVLPDAEVATNAKLVICADNGLAYCYEAGLIPDIAIGDFDSVDKSLVEKAVADGAKIYEYPSEKDETDLDLALKFAYRLCTKECTVYGALGGRLDHELINIYLLKRYAAMGMRVRLIGRRSRVEILTHSFPLRLESVSGKTVSIIPLSDVVLGIRTKGMKFELSGEDLASGTSRGASNVAEGEFSEISCTAGEAAIVVNNS